MMSADNGARFTYRLKSSRRRFGFNYLFEIGGKLRPFPNLTR